MAAKSDSNTQNFAFQILLKQVDVMLTEVEGVHIAEDIESIHRMRVASRRLRNALQVFQNFFPSKKFQGWTNALRHITKSLGAARDLDVQLATVEQFLQNTEPKYRLGARRLRIRLLQKRRRVQKKVQRNMAEAIKSNHFIEMHKAFSQATNPVEQISWYITKNTHAETSLPAFPDLYARAESAILHRLKKFLSYDTAIIDATNIKELHAMRIQAKWLRYTLETFGVLYPDGLSDAFIAAKSTQEYLGQIHDCDVWAEFLPNFIKREDKRTQRYYGTDAPFHFIKPGMEAFARDRAECRTALFEEFLTQWAIWQKESFWEKVRSSLEEYLISSPAQYQPGTEN